MKERLDKILVARDLVKSREIAQALILEGKVFVNGLKQSKAGTLVPYASEILIQGPRQPYVSRGGLKLEAALNFFSVDVKGKMIIDVGSSTGGFTDCLLQRGAKKVYCIDVGYGQIAWSLRTDPRVVLLERTNVRYLGDIIEEQGAKARGRELEDLILRKIGMATIDVSFISLIKVIPPVLPFLNDTGEVLALVKPQFEVGKGEVGKGGIVREEKKRLNAVDQVREQAEKLGLKTLGVFESPVTGQKGNIEYFLYLER